VSAKLTEEEHTKLLEICNKKGCTPSAVIKDAIRSLIEVEKQSEEPLSPLQKLLKRMREEQERKTESEPKEKSLLERLRE
jgi:intein/homing endonuclease